MAAQALDLLNNGKLKEAGDMYTSLLSKYPNSGAVPEALFRLGYIQYVQGDYANAVKTLNRITVPPALPSIKEAGDALIPQILAAQAGKMAPTDPKRKAAFTDAIKQFDAFVQKYPSSEEVETANYGRAMAAYQIEDFAAAEQSLQTNLQKFPTSETILDSEDLLAVTLTAEASSILQNHGDQQAGMDKFNQALRYLADIIVRHKDVALANDAQFQIGEVLFNRGSEDEGQKQVDDLSHAIDAYRAVLPKEQMVQAQEAHVAELLERRRQAVLNRNSVEVEAVQRLQDRENAKLQALKDAPDQTMNAQLRIAASYFLLKRYDEARVLLRYLEGFAQDAGDKKQIDYYIALTYASEKITEKAVAAYNDFESKYKGDPLGENLPIAIGQLFLDPKNNQPDKAISYLQQEISLYPKSPLVNQALGIEAGALISLQRYSEALGAYQKFLATKPPKDQAAQAELGIANIFQATNKIPEAIQQYQKIVAGYEGTPEAEQSAFYAAGLETSVDPKQALPQLQAFVKKYPNSQFTPQATMMIGQVQAALGDTASAMQTYKDLIAKFPKTDFAPQADFAQATILAGQQKTDEMLKVLHQMIEGYPDYKDIFYAYDTIGQTEATKGDLAGAIAAYTEMAAKHADNPMAATALYRISDLWRKQADAQGRYLALNEAQRKDWTADINKSIEAGENVLAQYPNSPEVGLTLKCLLADQQMLLAADQKKPEDIDKYFHQLADKFSSNPSIKSRVLFTLAIFTYDKDPAKALAEMKEAYNPSLLYAPADLDLYGLALIDQGKPDEAYKIFEKIGNDYPTPPGTQPNQAQPTVQEAQATTLFGMGSALAKEGKSTEAAKLFTQLKATYPWSPKVVEANYEIAKSMVSQNQLDDALKLLTSIVANRNVAATLRAKAFLLIGDIQAAKGNIPAAIDSYLKTADFYSGVADVAAEASWKGGQMLEKQAEPLTEQSNPKKSDQLRKAADAYHDIVTKFPNSPYLKQAQDRLNALQPGK